MKIKFTKVTNTEGLLNKTFSIDLNGQVKKESNALFSMGIAEVVEVNNLSEFYIQLENLQPNQAIISGIPDETPVNIVKKGGLLILNRKQLNLAFFFFEQALNVFAMCNN